MVKYSKYLCALAIFVIIASIMITDKVDRMQKCKKLGGSYFSIALEKDMCISNQVVINLD